MVRNQTWCSLKNEWKWITDVSSKWWWVIYCGRRHTHLEFALPSLKTESPHTRPIWRKADERDISIVFIWQLSLPWHLILWTLAYVLYWRSIFHVSHNKVSDLKNLLWHRGPIWMVRWWKFHVFQLRKDYGLCRKKIGNICEIMTIYFKQNLTYVLL